MSLIHLPSERQITRSSKYYSEDGFWAKLAQAAKRAGQEVIYQALLLYYTATSSSTPLRDRALIFGALGYFILPTDLIPDFIPVLGYTDDAAALATVIKVVAKNITDAIRQQAHERAARLFE